MVGASGDPSTPFPGVCRMSNHDRRPSATTTSEERLLDALVDLTAAVGIPPTLAELGRAIGRSPSRAHALADGLIAKGVLERKLPRSARALVLARRR